MAPPASITLTASPPLADAMKDQGVPHPVRTPCRWAKRSLGSLQNQRPQAFQVLISLHLLSSMRLFQAGTIAIELQISCQAVAMAISSRLFPHIVGFLTTLALLLSPFLEELSFIQVPAFRSGTASPYLHSSSFQPYPRGSEARRLSIASSLSRVSQENTRSTSLSLDEDGKERGRCPNPDCGRLFKDLKAHMLTHQSERPEKCPIMTCEYHQKGFARKYDKNRHTLTHYKGTMVCGFCPGSGSAAEKSFNRADVFKRHLTSLHGVEQTPPNSRKKSPTTSAGKKTSDFSGDAAGKCSTCSAMFSNAQEFYEHLDDCVLRVVQQEEPSEAINEQHLSEIAHDRSVLETLDRHMIHGANTKPSNADEDDEGSEAGEFKDEASSDWPRSTRNNPRSGKGQIKAGRDDPS
ncbi:MAG: hypothetical protein Q9226_003823 [Calogaya cf. arnoldii]